MGDTTSSKIYEKTMYLKHLSRPRYGSTDFSRIILYLCAMPTSTLITLCTCPNQAVAEEIANALIEQRVAACINIIPTITSIYKWQGKLESEREALMLIKTDQSRYPDLEQALARLHPYELPEIIAVPVEQGLAGYLNWVTQCTKN